MAQLNERSVDVSKIERFMMNGHVFGYRVTGIVAGFDKQGRRIHYGGEERAYYYDPDGSGKFSVMHYDNGDLIFKITDPNDPTKLKNVQDGDKAITTPAEKKQ